MEKIQTPPPAPPRKGRVQEGRSREKSLEGRRERQENKSNNNNNNILNNNIMKQLKNFLIKREQSQARLRFAKCEKSRLLARTLLTLVALFAMTTGAWADNTETVNITAATVNGTNVTVTATGYNSDTGAWMTYNGETIVVTSKDGSNFKQLVLNIKNNEINAGYVKASPGTCTVDGKKITVTGINASSVTFSNDDSSISISSVEVTFAAPSGTTVPLTWTEATKTATLTNGMPAGNVTVSVDYFAQAEFAKSTGETPEPLAPTAIAGVLANTDAPIVTPGTVANIGTSEVKQGTLMYYVSQTPMTDAQLQALTPNQWSDDVPTAADLLEGAAYVYYYIQGAEPATIAERTDANTCSDGDILAANVVNVTVLSNKFDLTLKAANVNTIDATQASKGSVTVKEGTGAAVDKTSAITAEGKLKAVKMGSEVKLKANNGYKFRKVEVKKTPTSLTITNGGQFSTRLDIAGCTTWDEVIDKNSDKIMKTDAGDIYSQTNQYPLRKGDGQNKVYVNASDPFDPNATDYNWAR